MSAALDAIAPGMRLAPESQRVAYLSGYRAARAGDPADGDLNPHEPGSMDWQRWVAWRDGWDTYHTEAVGYAAAAADAMPTANPYGTGIPERAAWAHGWQVQHFLRGTRDAGRTYAEITTTLLDTALRPQATAQGAGDQAAPLLMPSRTIEDAIELLTSGTVAPPKRPARRGIRLSDPGVGLMTAAPPGPDTLPLPAVQTPRYALHQVYDIPVGDLMPDPHQPRRLFDDAALRTLGASLRAAGQQHPIRFRERHDPLAGEAPLILVDGERRWRAAQLAGLATLRGILDTEADSGADLIARQALLNEPGRPLQPWDWVLTFNYLARELQLTPAQITLHLTGRGIHHGGKPWTRPQIANYLRLLTLPGWCQDLIAEGPLTPSHGLRILPHIERPAVMERLQKILTKACSGTPAPAGEPADDPDNGGTLCQAEQAEATRVAYTVIDLRADILRIYQDLYIDLAAGTWRPGNVYLKPRWDWTAADDQCQTCPQRAEIDGYSGRASYCMDPACLEARNAKIADTLTEPDSPATAERAAKQAQARADFDARVARHAEERAAIMAGIGQADASQLEALLLWRLLRYSYGMDGGGPNAPLPAAIHQHLTGHTAKRFLLARCKSALERSMDDSDMGLIREFLGLAAEGKEGGDS